MSEKNANKLNFFLGLLVGVTILSATGFFIMLYKYQNCQVKGVKDAGSAVLDQSQAEDIFVSLAGEIGLNKEQFSQCLANNKYTTKVNAEYTEGLEKGVRGTPGNFINGRMMPGALPLEVFKEEFDSILAGTRKLEEGEELVEVAVDQTANHAIGPENAPISLVIWDDFECPYCARLHQTMKQLIGEYGDSLRVAFKHFPLKQIHPQAQKAAEASECAAEQGKFWEYADKIYTDQSRLQLE